MVKKSRSDENFNGVRRFVVCNPCPVRLLDRTLSKPLPLSGDGNESNAMQLAPNIFSPNLFPSAGTETPGLAYLSRIVWSSPNLFPSAGTETRLLVRFRRPATPTSPNLFPSAGMEMSRLEIVSAINSALQTSSPQWGRKRKGCKSCAM